MCVGEFFGTTPEAEAEWQLYKTGAKKGTNIWIKQLFHHWQVWSHELWPHGGAVVWILDYMTHKLWRKTITHNKRVFHVIPILSVAPRALDIKALRKWHVFFP